MNNNMNSFIKFLTASLLLLAPAAMRAVPAYPGKMKAKQADGTELTIQLIGDEYAHMAVTADGYPLIFNPVSHNYEYATETSEGLKASGMAATETTHRNNAARLLLAGVDKDAALKHFYEEWTEARTKALNGRLKNTEGNKLNSKAPSHIVRISSVPTLGQHDVCVILVQFSDAKFTDNSVMTDPAAYYDRFFHEKGFSEHGARGSVYDYYRFASQDKYDPQFKVYGPVTVSGKASDYAGGNGSALTYKLIQEAVPLADSLYNIDFKSFDTDSDGVCDNVYCIYAGYGQADTGNSGTIWPHSSNLAQSSGQDRSFFQDGVKIDRYTVSQEVNGQTKVPVGIGTFVHEFGHVLGLADHYNNGSTAAYGYTNNVGNWDLMASGSYNDDQNCPPTYSAFERYSLGWTTPVLLSATTDSLVALSPYEDNGQCYRISVPGKSNEYFLIENRQQKTWDEFLPGHGVLVWHIDENQSLWDKNQPNADQNHQHVDIVEAGRTASATGLATDPFPGAADVRNFSFTQWNGLSVFGFDWVDEDAGGLTSFILSNSNYRLPSPSVAVDSIMGTKARVEWTASKLATAYNVMLYKGYERVDSLSSTEPGSAMFTDLTPQTEYTACVVATLNTVHSDTVSLTFTTLPLQIEEQNPIALEPSDVTRRSFKARWQPVTDADRYDINIYTRTHDKKGVVGTGFDNFTTSVPGLPEGWSVTAKQGRNDVDYGKDAPSIRLRADSAQLIVSIPGNKIDSVSFWHYESKAGLILSVDGYKDHAWTNLWQYESEQKMKSTKNIFTDGVDSLRFMITRTEGVTGGYILLDDVDACYMSDNFHLLKTISTTVNGDHAPQPSADGSVLSYTVNDLNPDSAYAYSIIAFYGSRLSPMSDTVSVDTTGVVDAIRGIAIDTSSSMAVFDLQGRQVGTIGNGIRPEAVLPRGVYIIRGRKIVVR